MSGTSKQPHILVVEDNAVARKVVTTALRSTYQVSTAEGSKEAMFFLKANPVDLVVLDILMPEMSGLELARWMRAVDEYKEVPIVFFTTVSDRETIREAATMGNVDYLLKPLRGKLLLERIHRILAGDSESDEVPDWVENPGGGARLGSTGLLSRIKVPTFSATTWRIIELINSSEADARDLAQVVKVDPGLSATLLRVVNSPLYALSENVSSVHDASVLIGIRDLSSICLSASLASENRNASDLVKDCWSYCLTTGDIARQVAEKVALEDASLVGLAGTLHGLGIIALLDSRDLGYGDIVEKAVGEERNWSEVEQDALETDHTRLGQQITDQMGLPKRVGEIIRHCEKVEEVSDRATFCVAVGSLVTQCYTDGFARRARPAEDYAQLTQKYPEESESLFGSLDAMLEDAEARAEIFATA